MCIRGRAGTVFTFGYNLIGALQRGLGNATASMSFVIISSAATIALDAVFIVWPVSYTHLDLTRTVNLYSRYTIILLMTFMRCILALSLIHI